MSVQKFVIGRGDNGAVLANFLRRKLSVPSSEARAFIRDGLVRVSGVPCRNPKRSLRRGQQITVLTSATQHSSKATSPNTKQSNPEPVIRFCDSHIIIVDKPAGLTTVRHKNETRRFGKRGRRYLPATLADLLPDLLKDKKSKGHLRPRAVHRLDKETSGLVVFARTPQAERQLGIQMRAHSVIRRYVALVRGAAQNERIETNLIRDRGDGRRGSAAQANMGKRAITHVSLCERLGGYSLIQCRLETGRTHQVRIHLGERGIPLCGERIYDRPLHGQPLPDDSGATRPLLHAAFLEMEHPTSGKRVSWSSPLPADIKRLLQQWRTSAKK